MLLEKAWAKLQGTYARTIAGLSSIAATHLLNVPAVSLNHDFEE
jgi:hypothetical protein